MTGAGADYLVIRIGRLNLSAAEGEAFSTWIPIVSDEDIADVGRVVFEALRNAGYAGTPTFSGPMREQGIAYYAEIGRKANAGGRS